MPVAESLVSLTAADRMQDTNGSLSPVLTADRQAVRICRAIETAGLKAAVELGMAAWVTDCLVANKAPKTPWMPLFSQSCFPSHAIHA